MFDECDVEVKCLTHSVGSSRFSELCLVLLMTSWYDAKLCFSCTILMRDSSFSGKLGKNRSHPIFFHHLNSKKAINQVLNFLQDKKNLNRFFFRKNLLLGWKTSLKREEEFVLGIKFLFWISSSLFDSFVHRHYETTMLCGITVKKNTTAVAIRMGKFETLQQELTPLQCQLTFQSMKSRYCW